MLASIKNGKQVRKEIDRLELLVGVDHMDAREKVLPFTPQFINPELHTIFNEKEELSSDSQSLMTQSVTDMLVAEASSVRPKFVQHFKSKVFKRFFLDKGSAKKSSDRYKQNATSSSIQTVSLQDIIMESWTGSRVYKFTLN